MSDRPAGTANRSLSRRTEFFFGLGYKALISVSVLLLIGPLIVVVAVSFNPTSVGSFPPNGFSLRWYSEFLQNDQFMHAFFVVSLPIALISGALSTICGVLAAYTLARYEIPKNNIIKAILIGPLMIPGPIIGFSLLLAYSKIGFYSSYWQIILGHTVRTIPFTIITALAAAQNLDKELEYAARNLGASKIQSFYRVSLPLMKSGVIAGFLLAFIISFADVNVALFLTGPNVTTLPVAMFQYLQFQSTPIIAAIATIQLLMILIFVVIIHRQVGFESIYDQ